DCRRRDRRTAHDTLANMSGNLRIAAEERGRIESRAGVRGAANDIANRQGRLADLALAEASRRTGYRGHAQRRIAGDAPADRIDVQSGAIDTGGDDLIRIDERPRPQVDLVEVHASVETEAHVQTRVLIRPVCPSVVRAIAVIPAGGRPSEEA